MEVYFKTKHQEMFIHQGQLRVDILAKKDFVSEGLCLMTSQIHLLRTMNVLIFAHEQPPKERID